ncbi:MAG: hypothetical protein N3G22_03810 [Candidatus Micrarchaeota archaeon]|nr:hypothetical protein [Candidatus Micrarchaeota archaeon]
MKKPLIGILLLLAIANAENQTVSFSTWSSSGEECSGWNSPSNARFRDAVYTTSSIQPESSSCFLVGQGGFNIPSSATIEGFQATVVKRASFYNPHLRYLKDRSVQLTLSGEFGQSTDKANSSPWQNTSDMVVVYGGPNDLWGLNDTLGRRPTPEEVNSPYFGMGLAAEQVFLSGPLSYITAYIDVMNLTVFYSLPPNQPPSVSSISISPSSPSKLTNMSCNVTVKDAENTTTTVYYEWYKNDINQTSLAGSLDNVLNNTPTLVSNLTSGNFSKMEEWYCRARAYDGKNFSTWGRSDYVVIVNSPPFNASVGGFSSEVLPWFLVNGSVIDLDSSGSGSLGGNIDISNTNITSSTGPCTVVSTSNSGTLFRVQYNCTINPPATANVTIGFTDTDGAYAEASASKKYGAPICDFDYVCEIGENQYFCPLDCGCNLNGFCEALRGENPLTCRPDCPCLVDGVCDAANGENYFNCPSDCPTLFNCTLSIGASCSLSSLPPLCCPIGTLCNLSSGSSGTCCIPAGSAFSCSSNSQCCLGKCQNSYCVLLLSCGQNCTSSSDCGSSCPFCATPRGGGQAVCSSCIQNGSSTPCFSDSSCCPGSKCSPSNNRCTSCFGVNETCLIDSDCCSGRCENSEAGVRKCAPPLQCSQRGGPCSATYPCCSNIETLFCDYLNPLPGAPAGTGTCRTAIPPGFACNSSYSCSQNTTYSCRAAAPLGSRNYCLASAFSGYLFPNWAKIGNANFTISTTARSGSAALQISSLPSQANASYIYNSQLALKNNSRYLLEFWTRGSGSDTGVRYAIYDVVNDAYLNSSGGWEFNRTTPIIHNSNAISPTYTYQSVSFKTLSGNVSAIEVRFYPASNGAAVLLDDVQITETPDFTMMAYIRIPSSVSSTVFSQLATEEGNLQGFHWSISDRTLQAEFYSAASGGSSASRSMPIPDSAWHHFTVSVNRSSGKIYSYIDGQPYTYGNFSLGRINASSPFMIGKDIYDIGILAGSIDEIRFYNRILAPSEVFAHYTGTYQQRCTVNITNQYDLLPPTAYFNAAIRLRQLDNSARLSLPFDLNFSSNRVVSGMDYSGFTASARHNATWVPNGKIGGAFNFTPTQAVEVFSPVFNIAEDFTLSAWVYPTTLHPITYIIGNADDNHTRGAVLAACSGGRPCLYVNGSYASATNYTLMTNKWTHLAAVWESGKPKIYADAVLLNHSVSNSTFISSFSSPGSVADQRFLVGKAYISASDVGYTGLIDEVRVFGRAFTQSEIRQLYRDSYLLVNNTFLPISGAR